MSDTPKELHGEELLQHAADLWRGMQAGKTIQFWGCRGWSCEGGGWTFTEPLWLYRVKPEALVMYLNVYGDLSGEANQSRRQADYYAGSNRTACIRVEFHHGQFDE